MASFFKKITKSFESIGKGVLNTVGGLLGISPSPTVQMEQTPEAPPPSEPVAPTPEAVVADAGASALDRDRRRRGSYAATRSQRPLSSLGGGKSVLG